MLTTEQITRLLPPPCEPKPPVVSERAEYIKTIALKLLKDNGVVTSVMLSDFLDISNQLAGKYLRAMQASGLLTSVKKQTKHKWKNGNVTFTTMNRYTLR